ncbi:MAG: hypothetical protein AAFR45_07740 [Pseudomonadota bacterium]
MTPRRTVFIVGAMVTAIIVAHVFMWRSDMPFQQKLVYTAINTMGWTIVFAPIFLVNRWLKAVEARNADAKADPTGK